MIFLSKTSEATFDGVFPSQKSWKTKILKIHCTQRKLMWFSRKSTCLIKNTLKRWKRLKLLGIFLMRFNEMRVRCGVYTLEESTKRRQQTMKISILYLYIHKSNLWYKELAWNRFFFFCFESPSLFYVNATERTRESSEWDLAWRLSLKFIEEYVKQLYIS